MIDTITDMKKEDNSTVPWWQIFSFLLPVLIVKTPANIFARRKIGTRRKRLCGNCLIKTRLFAEKLIIAEYSNVIKANLIFI